MPEKRMRESQAEQSDRFRKGAQAMIDAGELNPTDANERLEAVIRGLSTAPKTSPPPRKAANKA